MKIDYRELVSEVNSMTNVEGFIGTCLEFKDNMLFYDRDLVLAAYASTIELLSVSALFVAGLESDEAAEEVGKEITSCHKELPEQFSSLSLPLDVQNLGEYYAQGAGWVLNQRLPVYIRMVEHYRANSYYGTDTIDELLARAHRIVENDNKAGLVDLLGIIGARMLRGGHLRPFWFRIAHPRIQIIITGLQTIVNNFSVASYFSFPFEDIVTERQKRTKVSGNVVLDLGAFRNFRRGIGGFTDRRIVVDPDPLDKELEQLLQDSSPENVAYEQRENLVPLLLTIGEISLYNDERDPAMTRKALRVLAAWKCKEAAKLALELLPVLDPWDQVFQYCMLVLKELGGKAVPALRSFIRANPESPLLPVFADIVASGSKGKRKLSLLKEIFDLSKWGKGKELVCFSIARFGGQEARETLEQLLESVENKNDSNKTTLKKALRTME